MLRPRLAIAALATAVSVAGGITAGVLTADRPASTATGTVTTTQPPATTVLPTGTTGTPQATHTTSTGTPPVTRTDTGPPRISDPALAARHLFGAWQAGDRQRALEAATPTAVRTLFAISPSPKPRFTGCHQRRSLHDCNYRYPDGNADGMWYISMEVEGGASAGYRVAAVDAVRRFTGADTAAKHLMSAWLAGDRAEAGNGASAAAVDALWSRLGDRGYRPRFTGCTYRSFGFDCNYDYTAVGLGLTMRVEGGASVGWTVRAVRFANL